MAMYTIALDAMGGDNAPQAIVEGAKQAVEAFADVRIRLYGPEDVLAPMVGGDARIQVVHAPDVVGMHDSPMLAVRQKTESSIVKAVMAVRNGEADAVIDALAPIRESYGRISADKAYLESVMKSGAERAARLASATMRKVHRKVGLAPTQL